MEDMFSKISSMLDDPETAGKLKDIAASVMGQETGGALKEAETPELGEPQKNEEVSSAGSFDPSSILTGFVGDDRSVNLLRAIKPYMRQSRAGKIDSAIRIMQALRMISNFK